MGMFGNTLKKSIKISGIKYSTISRRINFDPSYISKWINSDLLPSYKTSSFICTEFTEILLENLTDEDICILCKQIQIEYLEDREKIKQNIYNKLYNDYLLDYDYKKEKDKHITENNFEMNTYSSFQEMSHNRNIIIKNLNEYRENSDSIEIFIISEILCCSPEDIIFLMDIKTEINKLKFKNITFNVFISESCMINFTKCETGIAFLNFLMIEFATEISYYRTKIMHSGLIISINNLLIHTAQFFYNNIWTLSHFTYDTKKINSFNEIIKNNILPVGTKLFEIYESTCPKHTNAMRHILSNRKNSVLIGTLDTFFLTNDLLKELFTLTNDLPLVLKNYLIKKHRINEQRLLNGEEFRYIIFREAFEKLVNEGRIRLIGQELIIPIKLRLRILQCINNKLSQFPNLKVKIINSYLVNEIKHKQLPNIYLSSTSGFFLMFPVNGIYKYCAIKDKTYNISLNRTFDNMWDEQVVPLLPGSNVIGEYLNTCKDLLFFE